jgi:hypothetical protein
MKKSQNNKCVSGNNPVEKSPIIYPTSKEDMIGNRVGRKDNYKRLSKEDYKTIGRITSTNIIHAGSELDEVINDKIITPFGKVGGTMSCKFNKKGDILPRGFWDKDRCEHLQTMNILKFMSFIGEEDRKISYRKIFKKDVRKFFLVCHKSETVIHDVDTGKSFYPDSLGNRTEWSIHDNKGGD